MDNQLASLLTHQVARLCDAINNLAVELGSSSCAVTKSDLAEMEKRIMSAISDYTTKLGAFFDRQDKAVADLQVDVQAVIDALNKINSNPGTLSPEDQGLLDGSLTRAQAISDKLDALDASTPPAVPPATP